MSNWLEDITLEKLKIYKWTPIISIYFYLYPLAISHSSHLSIMSSNFNLSLVFYFLPQSAIFKC